MSSAFNQLAAPFLIPVVVELGVLYRLLIGRPYAEEGPILWVLFVVDTALGCWLLSRSRSSTGAQVAMTYWAYVPIMVFLQVLTFGVFAASLGWGA